MKTVCVAVIVLSLVSVCQPASLQCKKLVKPLVQDQNVLGRWYLIGISSTYCLAQTVVVSLLVPSVVVDVTSERQNYYNITLTGKSYGFCDNVTIQLFYAGNSIYDIDDQYNLKLEGKAILIQTGCQDCLVMSGDSATEGIALFSRRPVITTDELKEFEEQANCLGLYKPQIFDSDHNITNCRIPDSDTSDLSPLVTQRFDNMFSQLFTCATDKVLYYPRAAYRWVQDTWASFW